MDNRGWSEKGEGIIEEVGYRRLEAGGCEVNISPQEAEALRQLNKTVKGILIEAIICTETEKLWRTEGTLSPEEVDKAYKNMEAKIDEVLQD